jgi:hypothetical protein
MTQCKVIAHELEARFLEQGDDTVTAAKWYGSSLESFVINSIALSERYEAP